MYSHNALAASYQTSTSFPASGCVRHLRMGMVACVFVTLILPYLSVIMVSMAGV